MNPIDDAIRRATGRMPPEGSEQDDPPPVFEPTSDMNQIIRRAAGVPDPVEQQDQPPASFDGGPRGDGYIVDRRTPDEIGNEWLGKVLEHHRATRGSGGGW